MQQQSSTTLAPGHNGKSGFSTASLVLGIIGNLYGVPASILGSFLIYGTLTGEFTNVGGGIALAVIGMLAVAAALIGILFGAIGLVLSILHHKRYGVEGRVSMAGRVLNIICLAGSVAAILLSVLSYIIV